MAMPTAVDRLRTALTELKLVIPMTTKEILSLPAGRETDALVAKMVMGWADQGHWPRWSLPVGEWRNGSNTVAEAPPFSTDIAAAWEIVERLMLALTPKRPSVATEPITEWRAYESMMPGGWFAQAETAPLAICRAALMAMEKIQ